jgi:hypothetical protein
MLRKSVILALVLSIVPTAMQGWSADSNDVVVQAPVALATGGTLEVIGTPGAGQTTDLEVDYCESDAQGNLLRAGCAQITSGLKISINQPISVAAGTYKIVYSNTVEFVQLGVGEKKVIQLKKIEVPKTSRPVSFSVFLDLTDPSMQALELQQYFATPQSVGGGWGTVASYCATKDVYSADLQACAVYNSAKTYHDLLNKVVSFGNMGSLGTHSFNVSEAPFDYSYVYVTDPRSGDFVSVLPGVYGIVFSDSETGAQQDQYSVKAE